MSPKGDNNGVRDVRFAYGRLGRFRRAGRGMGGG